MLPPELTTSKITTLYNTCELIRPDPTKEETKQKVHDKIQNPKINHIHAHLFCVELDDADVKKLERISYGNAQCL